VLLKDNSTGGWPAMAFKLLSTLQSCCCAMPGEAQEASAKMNNPVRMKEIDRGVMTTLHNFSRQVDLRDPKEIRGARDFFKQQRLKSASWLARQTTMPS
jgi:hypothetical protein